MILSFKNQFPNKILSGQKIHTIREDPHERWKPERKIHMATGVRTKNYDCFREDVCVSVQSIKIEYSKRSKNFVIVYIDNMIFCSNQGGLCVNFDGMRKLSRNDGFESYEDFFKWFSSDFHGVIIHWTDFRY